MLDELPHVTCSLSCGRSYVIHRHEVLKICLLDIHRHSSNCCRGWRKSFRGLHRLVCVVFGIVAGGGSSPKLSLRTIFSYSAMTTLRATRCGLAPPWHAF